MTTPPDDLTTLFAILDALAHAGLTGEVLGVPALNVTIGHRPDEKGDY